MPVLHILSLLLTLGPVRERFSPRSVAITHVTVVNTAGGPELPDRTISIRDGRITRIEKSDTSVLTDDPLIFDARGKFVIPGLWDMHVHLSWSKSNALLALVANGVTGVRDMGGDLVELDDWRTRIAAGLLVGPRIVRVGPILNGQKFNAYQLVTGNPDETRGVVRALKQVGVDLVKVHRRMPRDSYFALVDESKKNGLPVVGHIPMTVTPEEASDARQSTIEHTETLFEGTFSAALKDSDLPDAIRRFRADAAAKLFARFVRNRTVVTPTLVAYRMGILASDPTSPPDPRNRYVARSFLEAQKKAKPATPEELDGMKRTFAEFREVVRQMHETGVLLMAGTDLAASRVPGFWLHDELGLLVESGLSPLEALQAATLNPAKVMKRMDDFGTVESGRIADLVVLDGDPLADIRNTQRIAAVVVGGRLMRRGELDELLKEAERLADRN